MKYNHHTEHSNLVERIAAHLTDFPLNKPCTSNVPSDQLLNDVLTRLLLCYPGAYSDLSPGAPRTATRATDR